MKELLNQLDRGELAGENPNPMYQDDRAGLALRLCELEARIEDLKHAGDDDWDPDRYRRWEHCLEEVKCRAVLEEVEALGLTTEQAAYEILREVDLHEMPEEDQRHVEAARDAAWPPRDPFDRVVANLPQEWDRTWQQWFDDFPFPLSPGESWQAEPPGRKIAFLADYAEHFEVSSERFAEAARQVLGLEPGQAFPADVEPHLQRYAATRSDWERLAEAEDGVLTGAERRELQAGLTHDYGLRRGEDRGVKDEDEVERMPDHAGAPKPLNIVERARSVGEEDVVARAEAWPPLDSADPPLGDGRRAAETPEDHKVRAHADGATMDGERRMPSEVQMERVVNAIQSLREDYSFKRVDDEQVAIAPHGRGTEDGYFFWDELVPAHRRDALRGESTGMASTRASGAT